MIKDRNDKPDFILLLVIAFLVLLGLVVLSSVSAAISQQKFGSPYFYLSRFVLFGLLPGGLLGFLVFKTPLAFLKKAGHCSGKNISTRLDNNCEPPGIIFFACRHSLKPFFILIIL